MTRKLLILIDETEECDRAIVYATKQALRLGAGLVLLTVIPSDDFRAQSLFGVGDVMREEATASAAKRLEAATARATAIAPIEIQTLIREDNAADAIASVIGEDATIVMLVLAAGTGKDGPGPLVSGLARNAGVFPIPMMVVPGHLSDAAMEKLT